jgi:hypothetical protein
VAVRIEPKFTSADIRRVLLEKREVIERALLSTIQREAEKAIAHARSVNTYKDQTGNLRSSVGYVILFNGQQVFESFPGANAEGANEGAKVARASARAYPSGFVLIVVAGMNYGAAVEAKGFDVLTTAAIQSSADLRKAMEELTKKIGKLK